jgi:hypothetical protein
MCIIIKSYVIQCENPYLLRPIISGSAQKSADEDNARDVGIIRLDVPGFKL